MASALKVTAMRATALGVFGLLFAGSVQLAPEPASAQSTGADRVYIDLGRWTIYETSRARTCVLRHSATDGSRLALTKTGTGVAQLAVEARSRSIFVGDVAFAFDQDDFAGRVIGDRTYAPISSSPDIETAFRAARILAVRHGGASVATIPLDGSSSAFRLLKQCAEQGRLGMVQSRPAPAARPTTRPAAPPSAATSPQSTRTLPAPSVQTFRARNPAPRNRSDWVRENDYRRLSSADLGGGVLEYTLVVNSRGRVEECIVNSSSGSREFDAVTCRNLQRRARFDPALDATGNAVAGRFSSAVRLAPEG